MRRTKEEAAKTRQDLLDAALEEFSRKGYQATRLQDIASAAGTTRGAIYHHFDNKADLYRTLLTDANAIGTRAVQQAIEEGGTMVEILRGILLRSITLAQQDRRFKQVLALSLFRTGVDPELDELMQQRITESKMLIESVANFMQYGIDNGELRQDIQPETLARAFLSYQNGLFLVWLSGDEQFPIAEEAEALADILIEGMSPR